MPGINTPPKKKPPSQRRIVAPNAPSGSRVRAAATPKPKFNLGQFAREEGKRFAGSPIGRFLSSIPGSGRPAAVGASRSFWDLIGKHAAVERYDDYDAAGEAEKRHGIKIK